MSITEVATLTHLTMPIQPQHKSPLFRLPPETRLHIYSFLIPNNTLHIDLCTRRRPNPDTFFGARPRSVMSTLRQQLDTLNEITHINGLHLLLVCRRTRSEVLQLFAKTSVRFHCPECFKTFLPNVARGLGVGVEWMKHVEILFDVTKTRQMVRGQHLTKALAKSMAREVMQSCQKAGWAWYGMLYLTDREKWRYEPLKEEKSEYDVNAVNLNTVHGPPGLGAWVPATPQQAGLHDQVPTKWLVTGKFET